MVNPDVPASSAEQPQDPKDAGAPAATTVHKYRKHGKRSARNARRGSGNIDATLGRITAIGTRRHKRKSGKSAAGHDENEENKPDKAPSLLSPTGENEPEPQHEGWPPASSEFKSPKEVPVLDGVADTEKRGSPSTRGTLRVEPQLPTAPPPIADSEQRGEHGSDKVAMGNTNADAAGVTSPLSAEVVENAHIPGKAGAEDDTKEVPSQEEVETRKCRRMQVKRASCVSFQSPDQYLYERENEADAACSPSPSRRPSRTRCRKSDGDMRSLYSVVALKDLATTLKIESGERAHPASQQRIAGPKNVRRSALGMVGIAIGFAVALTLLLWLDHHFNPADPQVCSSNACAELTAAFEGVLNYKMDPCVDLNAFVCSMGTRGSKAIRESRTFVARQIKQYELDMVHIFTTEKSVFTASRVVKEFLLECTDSSEASGSTDRIIEFFDDVSVPWLFLPSDTVERHPLEVVLTLSLKWGIDTWFRAYVQSADYKGALALSIEAADEASTWFDFVRTLEEVGRRQMYFQLFYERYNATLPDAQNIEHRLAIERDVLSTLDAVRSPGTLVRPVIAHLAKLAAHVRNCTADNWLTAVRNAPGGSVVNNRTLVSVQDVRLLRAVDQLLSEYSPADLMQHLSWWLLQILIIIASPQDYTLIAGSRDVALKELKVECYRMMAARFGLLLASESAVNFFTRDSRRGVEVFLRGLLDFLGEVAAKASRLSDKAKVAIAKRIQDLDVNIWPLRVDASNATLWQLYEHFCDSCQLEGNVSDVLPSQSATNETNRRAMLLENWLHVNAHFWHLTAAERELMQVPWHEDMLDTLRYEPLTNRLRVSHAALRRPFYWPTSDEVHAANFGGLGAAFLTHALQMFVAPTTDIGPDVPLSTWPEIDAVVDLTDSTNCSAESVSNLRDVIALALAWHALQTTRDIASMSRVRLAIRDEHQVEHVYNTDQLFFLSYCLSRCAGARRTASQQGLDCNAAVRSIKDFGRTFNCTPGSPMVPLEACRVSNLF